MSIRKKTEHRKCKKCDKEFMALKHDVIRGKMNFCSLKCSTGFRNSSKKLLPHEIFFNNIATDENGCWIYKVGNRYGKIYIERKTITAHRYSYLLHKGSIPNGLCVCHKCDVMKCVNPDHLFLGTKKDNVQDMLSKNRGNRKKGSKHHRTILNEEQIAQIKRRILNGERIHHLKDEYGVNRTMLYQMKAGKSWNHVEPEKENEPI
jgi:hypothetical protein